MIDLEGRRWVGLRRDEVVAFVLAVAECEVGLVRVQSHVLQRVGVELGVEADATPLLAQVEQEPAGVRDALDGLADLRSAVASLTAEDIAGQTLAVWPDQRHWAARRVRGARSGVVAESESEMFPAVGQPGEADTRAVVIYPSANRNGRVTWVRTVAAGRGCGIGSPRSVHAES